MCREKRIDEIDYLPTRMSLRYYQELLSSLSPVQQQAVEEIGFSTMFTLTAFEWDSRLTRYLVEKFNVYRFSLLLDADEMMLSPEDVYRTMNIPKGNDPVIEAASDNELTEYVNILTQWRQRWEILKGSPITRNMPAQMIQSGDNGDWFKRDFVVLLVSNLIKGNQSRNATYKILYSMIDVSKIKELNRCDYTFKSLINSVEAWKPKPTSYFTSPSLFLIVVVYILIQLN